MKVAYVVPSYSLDDDVQIPTLKLLVRHLAGAVDLHVFTLRFPREPQVVRSDGATVHAIGGARKTRALIQRAIAEIRAEHRRGKFSLIHGRGVWEAGAIAVVAAKMIRVPVLVSINGGEIAGIPDIGYGALLTRRGRFISRIVLGRAALVTGGSSTTLRLAREVQPRKPARSFRLAPNPVDTSLLVPNRDCSLVNPESPRLLSVASLIPVKDHETLLRAFAQVHEGIPGATLTLAGEDPLGRWSQLQSMAAELGIAERVAYAGRVRHEELVSLYRDADLLLLTSRYENEPLVVLEAAAAGVPSVATNVGLVPDLAPAAIVPVAVRDHAALGAAAVDLLSNPERLGEIAVRARERVERDYAAEPAAARFLDLYRELASR